VFCQLEALRHCLPPSVRRTLDELPESLDETYERVLKETKKPNRDHARRLLLCLVAAIRPLDVKELAEVLAVDFDDAEGIPKLKPNWRWEDEEQALLSSCSSLITIVETEDSRVVQFSHFSVKEFLTSERLATSSGDVSRYHIDLETAHTILAQACIGVFLRADSHVEENDVEKSSPLAEYAALHWVTHAQFERVSSFLRKAMEYLFDLDRPYFAAWVELHDIDTYPNYTSHLYHFAVQTKSSATPLYYAALCGFKDLVGLLVVKYPHHVNARGGYYLTPLVAAMAGRHFQIVDHLCQNGADVNVRRDDGETPLISAAWFGDLEIVQALLDYKVDVNARGYDSWTPMHCVSRGALFLSAPHNGPPYPDVARLLLEHGADVNTRTDDGWTPLHFAARHNKVEVIRVLLEHGANVDAKDDKGRTPMHDTMEHGSVEVLPVLLAHGANIGAEDNKGKTAFQIASANGNDKIMKLLSEHGAKGAL
jgi:ankyrin repeat protein